MDAALLSKVNALRQARRAAVVVTRLSDASTRIVTDEDDLTSDPQRAEIGAAFRSGRSALVETGEGEVFLSAEVPPPRIVAIGAVHISQAMVPLAAVVGYDLIVVDPRTAFATPERFPNVPLHADWPETVLPGLDLDPYTALAALTHDPKIDDFAILHAFEKKCFYVGALGSRKTNAKRCERLMMTGASEADFESLRAPIGLEIGAASPAEIAVAVMAEIIEAFRKRTVGRAAP